MQLRQLEILALVLRHESFSGAADELGLTQPAVSMQMKALAEEMGVPLFLRRGRGLEPTAAVDVLAGYGARILRLAEDAKLATRLGTGTAQVLRVSASSTPGAVLPERIAAYQRAQPDVVVRLEVDNSRVVEDQVRSGEADVGVIGGTRSEPSLRAVSWCDDELTLVVAPTHPLAGRRQVRAEDLADERLLTREAGSATRTAWEATFLRANLPMPDSQVLGDTEALKHAVAAGLGIACISPLSARGELAAGELVALRVKGLDLHRPLSILVPESPVPVARAFVEYLQKHPPKRPRRKAVPIQSRTRPSSRGS